MQILKIKLYYFLIIILLRPTIKLLNKIQFKLINQI